MTPDQLIRRSLEIIASIWMVEPDQTVWHDDGFDWTPGSHLVRVRGSRPENPRQDRVRISVRTDLLQDVPLDDPKLRRSMSMSFGYGSSTYAMVYAPPEFHERFGRTRTDWLWTASTCYVNAQTLDWAPRFFAQMALMQPIDAEIRARGLADIFGGSPLFATGVKLDQHDEILEVANLIYAPAGAEPSRWMGSEEFASFAEIYGRSDLCFATAQTEQLTAEVPFGNQSALIELRADKAHPQLKAGLLVFLCLPHRTNRDDASELAAELNLMEAALWTDFPLLGCWHIWEPGDGQVFVAHSTFIPNALYGLGLATQLAMWATARAFYVRRMLWPDLQDLTMKEILELRFKGAPH
jgi:hypothetical protein